MKKTDYKFDKFYFYRAEAFFEISEKNPLLGIHVQAHILIELGPSYGLVPFSTLVKCRFTELQLYNCNKFYFYSAEHWYEIFIKDLPMAFLQLVSILYNWTTSYRLRPFSDHVFMLVFEINEKNIFQIR